MKRNPIVLVVVAVAISVIPAMPTEWWLRLLCLSATSAAQRAVLVPGRPRSESIRPVHQTWADADTASSSVAAASARKWSTR